MSLPIKRRGIVARLVIAPRVFVQHYLIARRCLGRRASAALACRLVKILIDL